MSREETFIQRFKDAKDVLKSSSFQEIVSLKIRERCAYPHDYDEFFRLLQQDPSLNTERQDGIRDHAWKISDKDGNSILLLEHETGLEILYVAGSISSIIALLIVIIERWKFRNNMPFHPKLDSHISSFEIRRINNKRNLIEDKIKDYNSYLMQITQKENKRLLKDNQTLERENKRLKEKIEKLSNRTK